MNKLLGLLVVLTFIAITYAHPVAQKNEENKEVKPALEDAKINVSDKEIPENPTQQLRELKKTGDDSDEALEAFFDAILELFNLPDTDEHKDEKAIVNHDDIGDEEIEATLDEFIKYLNSTSSDEIDEETMKTYLTDLFKGIDKILTALDQLPEVRDTTISTVGTSPDSSTALDNLEPTTTEVLEKDDHENRETSDESFTSPCKTIKDQPGVCVPYYLCDNASQGESFNEITFDMIYDACSSVLEVCCLPEHIGHRP